MQAWSVWYILFSIIIALFVRALTHGRRKLNEPKMYYYATLVAVVFWLLFNFLAVNSGTYEQAILFYLMMMAAISAMVAFIYFNAKSFERKIVPYDVAIGLIPLFFLLLFSHVMGAIPTIYGWALRYSFFERMWLVVISLVMIYSFYLMINTRGKIASEDSRWRMKVYLTSIVLAFLASVVLSLVTDAMGLPSLSSIGAGLFIPIGYFAFRR